MLINKLIADVEARAGVTKAFQLILGVSLITNVFMAGTLFTMDRTVRTIFMPPEISKSFWVDGRSLSPEYLEQMGSWIISQYGTVSPSTVDFQNNTLLKYVHPSIHGELAVRFKMGANRLKSENLSKIFTPREVRISEKGQSVVLIGAQSTWIADKRVPNDQNKAFLVTFGYDGSRTFIKELRETDPLRPFDAPATQSHTEQMAEAALQQESMSSAASQAPIDASAVQDPAPSAAIAPAVVPASLQGTALPPAPAQSSPAAKEALQSGVAPSTPNR